MVWKLLKQQQQRGAQLPTGPGAAIPREAVADRSAQDHEQAGGTAQAGEYPASSIENRTGDPSAGLRTGNTPSAGDPHVEWDEVVQPQQADEPPAGETELEQDERGEDAEQVAEPQAEQAQGNQDAEELDEAARSDRND